MQMFRSQLSKLLLLSLTVSLLASCGAEAASPASETTPANGNDTEAPETETAAENNYLSDNLPADLDLGGVPLKILARGNDESYQEIDAEDDGDVVNSAVFERNLALEERLNVDLVPVRGEGWQTYSTTISQIRASTRSGANEYQLIAGWGVSIVPLAPENLMYDLNTLPYPDTSQPWWNRSVVDTTQILGHLYFLTGDIGLITILSGAYAVYENNTMANQYDLESAADDVRNGTWTIDRLKTMCKTVYRDVDGNGVFDENDQYGFCVDNTSYGNFFAVGAYTHQVMLNGDKLPEFVPDVGRVSTLVEKIEPLFSKNGAEFGSYFTSIGGKHYEMFSNGQLLFSSAEVLLSTWAQFRDMEDEYTILPYPKLDESQEKYYVHAANAASLWCIPTDNPEPEAAAAVMEAMGCYNYNILTPIYFETCLQNKHSRNEDTIEMLNLIRDGAWIDLEYSYGNILGSTNAIVSTILSASSHDVASWYAKNEKKINNTIAKTVEKFSALE